MATGKFYPFQIYLDALNSHLDNLTYVEPSRYMIAGNPSDEGLDKHTDDVLRSINSIPATSNETDHFKLGRRLFQVQNYNINGRTHGIMILHNYESNNWFKMVATDIRGVGDINFLGHDLVDGVMYSETYVYVTYDDIAKKTKYELNVGADPLDKSPFTKTNEDNSSEVAFRYVFLFCDVYNNLGTDKELYIKDLPMGVYILNNPVTIKAEESWGCRLCTKFVMGSKNLNVSINYADYNTTTKLLNSFGQVADTLTKHISERETDLQQVKILIDSFKNDRHVNVPYIIDNEWFVNGTRIGSAVNNDLAIEVIGKSYVDDIWEGLNSGASKVRSLYNQTSQYLGRELTVDEMEELATVSVTEEDPIETMNKSIKICTE